MRTEAGKYTTKLIENIVQRYEKQEGCMNTFIF